MFTTVAITVVIAISIVGVLRADTVKEKAPELVAKATASAAFVFLGILRWSTGDVVGTWILGGLALCALGDLLLIGDRTFDAGLIAFLLGHVLYICSFRAALPMGNWSTIVLAPLGILGLAIGWWLWPHLGKRRPSVSAYIIVITVMVWGAFSTSLASVLPWTAAAGALLFYLSDLGVARKRFVKDGPLNRYFSLPVYYAGQILLALTIGS
jgi:uncharacterized membrane protein YhhN